MKIVVKKSGLDISLVAAKLPEKLRLWLADKVGEFAFREMKWRAPKGKTRQLWKSINKRAQGLEVKITPRAPHAIFVEEGTVPHEILPVNAQALRFEMHGKIIFAKRVSHPGTAPQPFVRETADATRARIPQFWGDLWRDVERW